MTDTAPSAPMQSLVDELRVVMTEQDERRPRTRRRYVMWAAAGVLLVGAPTVAAATGAIELGSDTLPDGSEFSHTVTTSTGVDGAAGAVTSQTCDITTIDGPNGDGAIAGDGCGPSGAQTKDPVSVVSVLAVTDSSALVSGIAAPEIAALTFADSTDPDPDRARAITLRPRPNDERHSFVFPATRGSGTLVGRDADGKEIARTTVPPLPAGTAGLFPSLPKDKAGAQAP